MYYLTYVHEILVNSIDSKVSVELIRMNIIALHIKCMMQLVGSTCKVNEDTFQLICIVPNDTPHLSQFFCESIQIKIKCSVKIMKFLSYKAGRRQVSSKKKQNILQFFKFCGSQTNEPL